MRYRPAANDRYTTRKRIKIYDEATYQARSREFYINYDDLECLKTLRNLIFLIWNVILAAGLYLPIQV